MGLEGDLVINPLTHAFIQITHKGKFIYIDPVDPQGKVNFFGLPKADYILITHGHADHWKKESILALRKDGTVIIGTQGVADQGGKDFTGFRVMTNGEEVAYDDNLKVKTLPAYNLTRKNKQEVFYHPLGIGNGYLLTLGEQNVYIAGDTECISELEVLKEKVDIMFLPMEGIFTMDPKEAGECALRLKPKIVYPYHQGQQSPDRFREVVEKVDKDISVRTYSLP